MSTLDWRFKPCLENETICKDRKSCSFVSCVHGSTCFIYLLASHTKSEKTFWYYARAVYNQRYCLTLSKIKNRNLFKLHLLKVLTLIQGRERFFAWGKFFLSLIFLFISFGSFSHFFSYFHPSKITLRNSCIYKLI